MRAAGCFIERAYDRPRRSRILKPTGTVTHPGHRIAGGPTLGTVIEVVVDRTVAKPADAVFDFLSDHSNNPRWQGGMQSCTWTTEPPIRVGSRYDQVARFLGREIRTEFEVTAFEPGRSITIESRSGPLDLHITRTVETDGDRTHVHAVIRGTPSGPMRFAEPLMAGKVRKDINADYDRLVTLLDGD